MAGLLKNTASQNVTFCLVNATTGAALTGATVTAYVTKDGTQTAAAGSVTELKVSGTGYGAYNFAPTQADTNGTDIGYLFVATSAIPVNLDFHTDTGDAYTAAAAVKVVTDQIRFTVANQVDANALTGGGTSGLTQGLTLAQFLALK